MVDYSAPQLRDMSEPFVSSVRAALSGRTRELERLAVELYARGLSARDIEDRFTDDGQTASVAGGGERDYRTAVGRVRRLLQARPLRARDRLSVRRRHCRAVGPGQRREAVVAASGICEDGRKSLLGLMTGSKEDVETVRAFSQDLRARGLGDPLLVVSDRDRGMLSAIGAPALRGAPDAQSPGQGPDRPMAGVQGAGCRLLSGALARDRAPTGYRRSHRLRRSSAERARPFRRCSRGLHRRRWSERL